MRNCLKLTLNKGHDLKHFLLGVVFLVLSVPAMADINVRTGPLNLVDVEVDIPVASSWTLGPTARFHSRSDDDFDVKAWGVGVRGNYWFNRDVFTQGWYFGPAAGILHVSVTDESTTFGDMEGSTTAIVLSGFGGYHWVWDSFNIMLGAGPVLYSASSIEVKDDAGNKETYKGFSGAGLGIEFTLGWKF